MSLKVQLVNTTREVEVDPKVSLATYRKILRQVCSNHKGVLLFDRAEALLRDKDYEGLVRLADHASKQCYRTSQEHYTAHQLSALVKKFPWPAVPIRKDLAALEKFRQSEHKCRRVNAKFRALQKRSPEEAFLNRMRKWIKHVIGSEPDFAMIQKLCGYGPGSSVLISGSATHDARKFLATKCSVTPGAVPFARAFSKSDPRLFEFYCRKARGDEPGGFWTHRYCDDRPRWYKSRRSESELCGPLPQYTEFCGPSVFEVNRPFSYDQFLFDQEFNKRAKVVDYNKIALVPKTILVDRTIGVEPLWNGFLQKGIGDCLALLLKKVGLDISDQGWNGHLAFISSLFGHQATIDLSSASDTIAIELVRFLLPPAWFALLNSTRSKNYRLPGSKTSVVYEKFASMGNGFTFPLETLLFAAVCEAANQEVGVKDRTYSVYGDDIIVSLETSDRVLQMLRYCGFTPNPSKTFTSGSFRESCGKDWFGGINVRPLTIDDELPTWNSYFCFHNLIMRSGLHSDFFAGVPAILRKAVPPKQRFVRPVRGVIDSAFEVELDVFMTSRFSEWDRNTSTWRWREYVTSALQDTGQEDVQGYGLALVRSALNGVSSSSPFQFRRETETKVRKVSHHGICEDSDAPLIYYSIRGRGEVEILPRVRPSSVTYS